MSRLKRIFCSSLILAALGGSPAGLALPRVEPVETVQSVVVGSVVRQSTVVSMSDPANQAIVSCGAPITLRYRTKGFGLERRTQTFSAALVDLDNDGDDDLMVGNHGAGPPALYRNLGGRFVNRSAKIPVTRSRDRHGITVVDLDNDGDRDVLIAAGGGGVDAQNPGSSNEVLRNLLVEDQRLRFANVTAGTGIALQPWRGRHLLAVPNAAGSLVDLVFLNRFREGRPTLYLENRGVRNLAFRVRDVPGLAADLSVAGRDVPLDFDRDGRIDLLLIDNSRAQLLMNTGFGYQLRPSALDSVESVESIGVGDLDNDGYPDVYVGVRAPDDPSDFVNNNGQAVNFLTWGHQEDAGDAFSFNPGSDSIEFEFRDRNRDRRSANDIFLGAGRRHPDRRFGTINAAAARGRPVVDRPGIYVWREAGSPRWHVQIRYAGVGDQQIGTVGSRSISAFATSDLEEFPAASTSDRIFLNMGGANFEEMAVGGLQHSNWTRSVVPFDLNNDGWLDIMALRSSQRGKLNGRHALFSNCGGLQFSRRLISRRDERIYDADVAVAGFVNQDGLPDLFYTNGYGFRPTSRGPYQLLINESSRANAWILLDLVGRRSNRDAIGAQVELYDQQGTLLGYRLLAYRGRAQDSHLLHFGLGDYRGNVRARIWWPSGEVRRTQWLAVNRRHRILEP